MAAMRKGRTGSGTVTGARSSVRARTRSSGRKSKRGASVATGWPSLSSGPGVDFVHRPLEPGLEDAFHRMGRPIDDFGEIASLPRVEFVEDVIGPLLPLRRLRNTDTHTREVLAAEVVHDRPEPVVPCEPSAHLHSNVPEGKIEFVVHDHYPVDRDLVPTGKLPDWAPRFVHECKRSGKYDTRSAQIRLGDDTSALVSLER